MTSPELDACFSLVRATSQKDYEGSSRGWNPSAKREEMRDPDLRYVLIKDSHHVVKAFTSLMPTIEEGQPVVYCYEIHLEPELRGTGLAKLLMDMLETVAYNIDVVDKVMLTVFTCNKRALDFYHKCGFARDEISPQPRALRGGKVKLPEYEILSKRVGRPLVTNEDGVRPNGVLNGATFSRGDERGKSDGESTLASQRPAKMARLDLDETGL
ncbi:N alpha-acetyl-transferase [Diaporthe australafricana]|uniref:N-alpha-acetyltransferase 40 n=1 Tax=Diaporthe australafricana TaxID=127596 RepID=A0ABR3WD60_9PEZI